jgi:hypothetical protein
MRTKTLALSALLGMLGSASLVAQTNVYSLNAVGYINVTLYPGFNLIGCPLICSPDNTLGTLFPDGGGGLATSNQFSGFNVWQWDPALTPPAYLQDSGNAKQANKNGFTNGWINGGTIAINPGQGIWIQNPGVATNVTFVGTVPQGSLTNTLTPGFNMVSSAIPMSGDLVLNTNTLLTIAGAADEVYYWDPTLSPPNYDQSSLYSTKKGWAATGSAGDPTTTNITEAFWYFNNGATSEQWVENFSINP